MGAEALGYIVRSDSDLAKYQTIFSSMGDSAMKSNTQFHFVTYVEKGGFVWELDGRRSRPIKKDCCTKESFGLVVG